MNEYLWDFIKKFDDPLVLFGFAGQFVFMTRFLIQWYVSEKRKRSTVPVIFWWISTLGGLMLLTYGLLDRDPVIVMGQGLGVTIYLRNLWLIYQRKRRITQRRQQSNAAAKQAALKSNAANEASSAPPSTS
jgi:lipid-A-disaccharide synthase-like uncharacterized protein